jgi:hypothetical protein
MENRGGNPILKRLKKDWIIVNGKVKSPGPSKIPPLVGGGKTSL